MLPLQDRVTKERVAAVQAKIAAAEKNGKPISEIDAVAATEPSAKEEEIKDAQPQPIEEGATKEEAVKNAEATADAPEEAEELEEGEISENK